MANRDINFKIIVDGKEANAVLNVTEENINDIAKAAKGMENDAGQSFSNFGNIITGINQGIELTQKALSVLSAPINAAAQFEGYETSLNVMLGSTEAAQARLEELIDFAASTPFELPDVIELGNQLQAIGKYSQQTMTDLGDLAAASGKPINQVVSAFGKLATGQKGVAVDMFRDLLISTADWEKAVGKSIDKITSDDMMGKLPEIMKSKGFAGMMDEQSKTFNGMLSNFQDTIGGVLRDVGMMILPLAKSILDILTPAFSFLKDNIKTIIPYVGILTGMITGYIIVSQAAAGITALKTAALALYTGATGASSAAVMFATVKTWLWNAALAANPAGLIIAGIVALIGTIALLSDAFTESAAEKLEDAKATEKMINQNRENVNTQIEEKRAIKDLVAEYEILLNKKNKTAEETKKLDSLYIEINNKYPGLVKSQDDFTGALDSSRIGANKLTNEINGLINEYDNLSEAALLARKNVNLAERDVAADLLDQVVNTTYEDLWTNADLAINEEIKLQYKQLKNRIYHAKTLNELSEANFQFQNKMSELQKKYKEELDAQEIIDLNNAAQKFADAQKKVFEDRQAKIETFADKEKQLAEQKTKEEAERLKAEEEKRKENAKKNQSKAEQEAERLFKTQLDKLKADQNYAMENAKIENLSGVALYELKQTQLNELIDLYKKHKKDVLELERDSEILKKEFAAGELQNRKEANDIIEKEISENLNKEIENIELKNEKIKETNLLQDIQLAFTESLAEGYKSAGDALAASLGANIQIFEKSNNLLTEFINNLVRATAQALILRGVNAMLDFAAGGIGSIFESIFGGGSGGGAVPGLATGGIVTKPTLAMIGEGGVPEAVIPLNRLNGFNNSQTINIKMEPVEMRQSGTDMRAVLQLVENQISKKR